MTKLLYAVVALSQRGISSKTLPVVFIPLMHERNNYSVFPKRGREGNTHTS